MRGLFAFPRWTALSSAAFTSPTASSSTGLLPTQLGTSSRKAKFVMVTMDTLTVGWTGVYLEMGDSTVTVNTATAPFFPKTLFENGPLILSAAGCTHIAFQSTGADTTIKITPLDNW